MLFSLSPGSLLAVAGVLRGPERREPTPAEDWRRAVVDVVIPASRHQHSIVHCLASLLSQTRPPRRVVLVDDGGSDRDHTAQIAREFAIANGMDLVVIERLWSIGRTPTIKRQARELDCDVEFILDGDTVLESPDYIERCVRELYQGVGIASVGGLRLPMRARHRRRWADSEPFRRWVGGDDYRDPYLQRGAGGLARWIADGYRECAALFSQGFVQRGQMALLGGVAHPAGGAVAYRRRYLKDLFDRYEPHHGEDMSAVPEIFIGLALDHEGYRHVQLADLRARALEAGPEHLPRQLRENTMAFLQCCRAFDALLRTPFQQPRQWWRRRQVHRQIANGTRPEQRRVVEAYRQPFGARLTHQQGRPIGWALVLAMFDRLAFPATLLLFAAAASWAGLLAVVAVEALAWLGVLMLVSRGERLAMVGKALIAAPLRYPAACVELYSLLGFIGRSPVSVVQEHRH